LAKGTPEGNAEALRLGKAQLIDAGAHGADRSPDYAPMLANLAGGISDLEKALDAAPGPDRIGFLQTEKADTPNEAGLDAVIKALNAAGVSTVAVIPSKPNHGLAERARPTVGAAIIAHT
jgi:hypothetical protein